MTAMDQPPDTGLPCAGGLRRRRLLRALDPVLEARLGVVLAPPGAGKTTLLAHWAAEAPAAVLWHRTVPQDAVPGRLLEQLSAAVAALTGGPEAGDLHGLAAAAGRAGGPLCLVVDDLHLLAGTTAETDLEQLLLLAPPGVHLLVGSRCAPGLNLARSELSPAVVLDGDDLRFRVSETQALFRDVHRRPLDPSGALALTRRTDGWAAALQLFDVAVAHRTPVERRRAAGAATTRYAWDYVARHVLADVSPQEADLLHRTSAFAVLTAPRCDAVLGRPGSALPLLRDLERRGLVVGEDGGGLRVPEVVRQYLADGTPGRDPARTAARRRAAEVLEEEGAPGDALWILAEDGDWGAAQRVLHRAGAAATGAGSCSWCALLPEPLPRDSPWFAVARARQLLDDGCLGGASAAAAQALEHTDGPGCSSAAEEILLRAAQWGAHAPVAVPESPLRSAVRRDPVAVARSLGADPQGAHVLDAGLAWLLAGDQHRALPLLRRCATDIGRRPFAALAGQLVLSFLEADSPLAGPRTAAAEIEAVAREAHRRGFTWLARLAQGALAALEDAPGGAEFAAATVRDCERRGDGWGAALLCGVTAVLRSCDRGDAPGDEEFDALAHRFRALGAATLEAWARSLQAVVSATGHLPSADVDVRAADAFARAARVPGAVAVSYAAMARHHPGGSAELWQLAADTAEAAGFVRPPRRWLAPVPPDAPPPDLRVVPPGRGGAGPPDVAVTCFGEFVLSLDGTAVDLTEVRPLARSVLRMLALHAGRPVHREQLVAALWGELGADRALHSLQVSISALRRALGEQGRCDGRSLLVRRSDAYVLCLEGGSRCDLLDFDRCLREASQARLRQDLPRAARALQRAVELYAGEVLPEEGPAEWVLEARDRYRLRAAEAASALARAELALGQGDRAVAVAARGVEINPWSDESWRLLIDLLRDAGAVAEAELTRRRYHDMLHSLGISSGSA